MKKLLFSLAFVGMLAGFQSCKNDDDNPTVSKEQQVKENYANIVYANYKDSHTTAVALKEAIDAFVANPTQAGLNAAKTAWLAAREPYGQTEAFRFTQDGPIDTGDDAVEGFLNAWPLDESFIDYVNTGTGESNTNIINNTTAYPVINADALRGTNESGGEKTISVGYHAIEFLLWGQDTQVPTSGPVGTTGGNRSYTDYVDGQADNADRRRQYLKVTAEILVDDLSYLVNQWKTGSNNYRATFLAKSDNDAIRNILTGAGVLAGDELANERIYTAVSNNNQEHEHSCFSDNTHRDTRLNYQGVKNVFTGSYKRVDGTIVSGTSVKDLLEEANTAKATEIVALMSEIEGDFNQTTIPFDLSISNDAAKWNEIIAELRTLGNNMAETSVILGVGAFPIGE